MSSACSLPGVFLIRLEAFAPATDVHVILSPTLRQPYRHLAGLGGAASAFRHRQNESFQ